MKGCVTAEKKAAAKGCDKKAKKNFKSYKTYLISLFIKIVPIPVWRETGMGFYHMNGEATNKVKKNPHESRMVYYKLPMNGLAGVMK